MIDPRKLGQLLLGEWNKTEQPLKERGTVLPIGEYEDGSVGLAWPALLNTPYEALRNFGSHGYGEDAVPYNARQAFDAAGLAMTGGLGVGLAGGMVDNALGSAGGKLTQPQGIRAYHGSPHDFDRFSLDKIGTGEGAQAYGHGLYFAESEDVARSYRDALKHNVINLDGLPTSRELAADELANRIRDAIPGVTQPYNSARMIVGWMADGAGPQDVIKRIDAGSWSADLKAELKLAAEAIQNSVSGNTGRMYEVNIKANPEDFLDWDKPLSQQSEAVRRALFDQSSAPQRLAHTGSADAEVLGSLGQRPSAFNEADSLGGVPSSGVMGQGMFPMVNDPQVLNPVVGLYPVDVMNVLGGQQFSPKMGGHDSSMLFTKTPVDGGDAVPFSVGRSNAPSGSPAGRATEQPLVGSDVVGVSRERLPALLADQIDHMSVQDYLARFSSGDAATKALKDQGVAGIRYLDGMSRGAGEGSSNYVVFDDALIDILRKYANAPTGAAVPLGMAAAEQNTDPALLEYLKAIGLY